MIRKKTPATKQPADIVLDENTAFKFKTPHLYALVLFICLACFTVITTYYKIMQKIDDKYESTIKPLHRILEYQQIKISYLEQYVWGYEGQNKEYVKSLRTDALQQKKEEHNAEDAVLNYRSGNGNQTNLPAQKLSN